MQLYQYPPKAKVDQIISKNKFYQQGKASGKIEQLFVAQVENIRWAYKLASTTIRIEVQEELKEIQILRINSRVAELNEQILRFIDHLIPSPIIFEVVHEGRVKIFAAYKRLNQADKSKVILGQYFASTWLEDTERLPLPLYLKLEELYQHLLEQLLPINSSENLAEHAWSQEQSSQTSIDQKIQLVQQRGQLQQQIIKLKSKLGKEKQFKRKIEINQQIRQLEHRLAAIKGNKHG